jgi:hypothetical protein
MDCVRDMYSRWDVTVTDVDPGNVPHIESIVTTTSSVIGMPPNVGGVSPFTLDCTPIENSIVFTFADAFGGDPQTVCEVIAQETTHSHGLDHVMDASDPMTYLDYNGARTFKDADKPCGEYSNRPCGIGGNVCYQTQNSVQLLTEVLGLADGDPPDAPGDPRRPRRPRRSG